MYSKIKIIIFLGVSLAFFTTFLMVLPTQPSCKNNEGTVSTSEYFVSEERKDEQRTRIIPGTKWCGRGNVSLSFEELGRFGQIDSCCREHDSCSSIISVGETRYGLRNTGSFTWSHCDCDQKLYKCLNKIGGLIAKSIRFTYFTVFGPKCFKKDFPIIRCVKYKRIPVIGGERCMEYELDKHGQKRHQWFDNILF